MLAKYLDLEQVMPVSLLGVVEIDFAIAMVLAGVL